MKKQLICASAVAALTLIGFTGMVVGNINTNAADTANPNKVLDTNTSLTTNNTKKLDSKNETVYVISDATGAAKSIFIGSTIYDGDEALPFAVDVKYYLEGTEVSATELLGKSGRVKIVYNYYATATYLGKSIPFVAVTGVNLDGTKFSNVKVTNGKIVSEGESYMVLGCGMPGMNDDLGIDFAPEEFVIEADAADFTLGTTYTVLMNDLIADLDTSKLTDIDGLINSINQLSDGMNQLVNGGTDLSKGLEKAANGTHKLHTGAKSLADSITSAAEGASQLATGLNTLTGNNTALQEGATAIIASTLADLNASILANAQLYAAIQYYGIDFPVTVENYATSIPAIYTLAPLESLTKAKSLLDFATGVIGYTNGAATIAAGADELAQGLGIINSKTPELVNGLGSLSNGIDELYAGSLKLSEGLATFKSSGIDRLTSFANNDLATFTRNVRSTVAAARSYHNYGGSNAESVKFIIKIPSVK